MVTFGNSSISLKPSWKKWVWVTINRSILDPLYPKILVLFQHYADSKWIWMVPITFLDPSLLAEYYGQSENHFFKCAYGTMAILQTWKPFCKVAPITVICPLFKKLFPFFETWYPYFTKWLSNWCHQDLSIWQTWFSFLEKWMTYSKHEFQLSSARKHLDEL